LPPKGARLRQLPSSLRYAAASRGGKEGGSQQSVVSSW